MKQVNAQTLAGYTGRRLPERLARLTSYATFNVGVLVLILLGVVIGFRIVRQREQPTQLRFYEQAGQVSTGDEPGQRQAPVQQIFSGEVYDTAVRLRETSALGIAISLAVFGEAAGKGDVPASLEHIWAALERRSLMPPELVPEGNGLSSPTSVFAVRYRSHPLQFEVISIPRENAEGPALMFRFPIPATSDKSLSYYRSSIARRSEVPPPFASPEQLFSIGWTIETWRGELIPRDEGILKMLSEEQNAWSGQR
jgi:hypothetical protein